jgi:hypothetical protein
MGGLWVDYNLMSNVPGLYVIGEANFSDHGANRLGASALMQGLADGYFVLPNTIGDYLAAGKFEKVDASHAAAREAEANVKAITRKLLDAKGKRSVDSYHRELGKIMWDYCGMARNAAGLKQALALIPPLREQYWSDVKVLGTGEELNQSAPRRPDAWRDFFELAELMCRDALGATELRRPFPRRVSDSRGRGRARRRTLCVRRRLGLPGREPTARSQQRAPDFRIRAPLATELQVMKIILHIWRQRNSSDKGKMVRYEVPNVNHEMSFLEMLDVLNEDLIAKNEEPVAFDHDCREGICGMCGCMVNGMAHGPLPGTTLCQLHMRHFKDGDELYLEPWRAKAFPVIKDLVVDRGAFDRIIAAGGYSPSLPEAPPTERVLIPKGKRGTLHGRRRVYRVRRLCRHVPERFGRPFHRRQDCPPRSVAARAAGAGTARHSDGGPGQAGTLRQLHQHRRMRSGLPQGDQTRSDRAHEPRFHSRQPGRTLDYNARRKATTSAFSWVESCVSESG